MKLTEHQRKEIVRHIISKAFIIVFIVCTGLGFISPVIINYVAVVAGTLLMLGFITRFTVFAIWERALLEQTKKEHFKESRVIDKLVGPSDWIGNTIIFVLCIFYRLYIPAAVDAMMGFMIIILNSDFKKLDDEEEERNRRLRAAGFELNESGED